MTNKWVYFPKDVESFIGSHRALVSTASVDGLPVVCVINNFDPAGSADLGCCGKSWGDRPFVDYLLAGGEFAGNYTLPDDGCAACELCIVGDWEGINSC